ncbi:MAG: ABC transporter substrate-binding protein [Planctomycetaceae bacterium]|nr:ABC transporter substrate-binding protein [Planctomycetaceae bacterium]
MRSPALLLAALAALLCLAWLSIARRSRDALVVYCAHDLVFAQDILDGFERETGIPVVVVGDTEATKSLGLVQRILREQRHPQCDVFWNNQTLGTMQLAEAGALESYRGPGFDRIPDQYKDPDGLWTGFAGRLRVWIVNQQQMEVSPAAIEQALQADDLSGFCLAQPIYGTTLSHCSVLWNDLGPEGFEQWYLDLQSRHARFVPGNATVKNLVAAGVCNFGWTDTDDFFVGLDAGAPVAMLPIEVADHTLCLPNSVAIVNGTSRRVEAERLVDYLLSEQVELRLAQSESRQIPLGPVDESQLPDQVRELLPFAERGIDIGHYSAARQACLGWLLEQE